MQELVRFCKILQEFVRISNCTSICKVKFTISSFPWWVDGRVGGLAVGQTLMIKQISAQLRFAMLGSYETTHILVCFI